MKSNEIRKKFLEFFESRTHEIVSSAPMVIKGDPTLMFTNAGMNQFKDLFLGNKKVEHARIADTQKCLRVSGKHNDLEEVGVDSYHHTMFEMLGNWSFGDYFKQEAIDWAWELLTKEFGIDPANLYVTVFGGDEADGLGADTEAEEMWSKWMSKDKILRYDRKDNFWEMGETGPCGPCSEIHIDIRSDEDKAKTPGAELVNQDHPLVIEIWNLVFMEFNRMANRDLVPLPAKHIDTGMGFERLAMVLQGKQSNYDTDIFQPLIRAIEKHSGKDYKGTDEKMDVAIRVIADHVRAVSFSIADGQLPSNTGAGYVIRRILRRAIRYSFSFLDMKEPFIHGLVEVLQEQLGDAFPELRAQKELIGKVIHEEEENFLRTLDKGIGRLKELIAKSEGDQLSGKAVFELYDTFGFPEDLTALIAAESGKTVNHDEFSDELGKQKDRSRAAGKIEAGDWVELLEDSKEEFIGYDSLETTVKITKYREVTTKGQKLYQLVFNLTPFYPEGGGQVGDTGYIELDDKKTSIVNTLKENNLIIHISKELPDNVNGSYKAVVNSKRRENTGYNHTATHLMHHALRSVLGTHVEQKGSLVHPDYLRFDFSHFSKVTDEELEKVETMVNRQISANYPLEEHRNMPLADAQASGAMMLFGEKYEDVVRMIQFGESKELCGGTHVPATGSIGMFKIVSESAVAAGIRRIEAITNTKAEGFFRDQGHLLDELKGILKNPQDVKKAVEDLVQKNAEMSKELEKASKQKAQGIKQTLLGEVQELNGVNFISVKVDLSTSDIKDIAFQLRKEKQPFFGVFASAHGGKPTLTCAISDDLVNDKELNAGAIIRDLAKEIGGGGGGQAFFATAGGKDAEGLDRALKKAADYI